MKPFHQHSQQVGTQYNADQINIHQLPPIPSIERQDKYARRQMLERIQTIWIDGVLNPSLYGDAQITLELQKKPSAVINPFWHVLREFDKTGQLSSANSRIVQVYDHASGEVLILGEPGAGKSTLLLELTRDLLERARQDEDHPIPVVFPLSSWALTRQPFAVWLAAELRSKYQISHPLATSWIERNRVLPLLDGLDEVDLLHREACVEAINTYRQEHGLLPTVVCSRQADYFALSTRLLLRTAVIVQPLTLQPLTLQQINSYLSSGSERLEALRLVLHRDADLQTLASTPLMLKVLTVAYEVAPSEEVTTRDSLALKREQAFASYVQRMLSRQRTGARYSPERIIDWLSHLAKQMKREGQTVFYIEQMGSSWLSGSQMLQEYNRLVVRLLATVIGVLVSVAISTLLYTLEPPTSRTDLFEWIFLGGWLGLLLSRDLHFNMNDEQRESSIQKWLIQYLGMFVLISLSMGLIEALPPNDLKSGWNSGLSFGICSVSLQILLRKIKSSKDTLPIVISAWRKRWLCFIKSTRVHNEILIVGLFIGMRYALKKVLNNLSGVPQSEPYDWLGDWLSYGLSNMFISGLLSILLGRIPTTQLADRVIWKWRIIRRKLFAKHHINTTLLIAVTSGILGGISQWNFQKGFSLHLSVYIGLKFGLSYWLLFGLLQGILTETIENQYRIIPNQGIRSSTLNSITVGLICFPVVGLFELLINSPAPDSFTVGGLFELLISRPVLSYIITAFCIGVLAGLLNGGMTVVRHYILRIFLWCNGVIPWNYTQFLDAAVEYALLRKVGGGYIFLHQLLLDYFANRKTEPSSNTSI